MITSKKGPVRVESKLEKDRSVITIIIKEGAIIRGDTFHVKNQDFDLTLRGRRNVYQKEIKIELVVQYKKKWKGHKKLSPIKRKIPKNHYELKGDIILKQRMYCSNGWINNAKEKPIRMDKTLGLSKSQYTNYKITNVKKPYQAGSVTPK
ncbi:MAG TPA: hypothetical protein IAB70_07215 [Candidatus Merdicola faecigallinarum]|uniref:Uncharacterized protein n=1 Tax=Candidatus Merdicola faecigallinarum TaxID=2840862 RepID=A0A9D1M1X4_9FIRM|nr:hypothetical protein [Candidatus Merdicola faecigallinarum]